MRKCIVFPIQGRVDLEHLNLFFADDEMTIESTLHVMNDDMPYVIINYTKNKTKKKQKKGK